jgi:hypothetical protein
VTFLGTDGPKHTKVIQTYWNCPVFPQVGVNMFSEVLYYTAALSAFVAQFNDCTNYCKVVFAKWRWLWIKLKALTSFSIKEIIY